MANSQEPKNHDFKDMLRKNPFQKKLNYNQLKERAEQKKADIERTKNWIENEYGIKQYLEVPQIELALIDHYSEMAEVEIDPDVKEFWETQKDKLNEIDMETPKNDYMSAYKEWQGFVESMDERRRSELGVSGNDFDYQELKANEGIQKAREGVKDAKRRVKDIEYDVDPFKMMIGKITGTNKDDKKIEDAHRGLRDAKRGLRDAKRNLDIVRERRAQFEESKDKLRVKEAMALDKMLTAQEKMTVNQNKAQTITENAKAFQDKLHQQYELIDKYKAIQKFKTSNDYVSARVNMKTNNPELFKKIEAIPESLPQNVLKVTLQGPLQLPSNTQQISELDAKIAEAIRKLPFEINQNDENLDLTVAKTLNDFKLKESDTVESLEATMATITDTNSKEYKQLEMKRDHLKSQQQVESKREEIRKLTEEIKNFTGTDKELQPKLKDLKTKKDHLKIIEEELNNDPYSKNLAGLHELQNLIAEREEFQSQNNLNSIESTTQELKNSNYRLEPPQRITVAILYNTILESVLARKEEHVNNLAVKYGREHNQENTRNTDEGR